MISWHTVRRQFRLVPHRVNLAGMSMASHVRPVRKAIARHRRLLDSDPYPYLNASLHASEDAVCKAVSAYFGIDAGNVALTSGTTQGLSLLYAGLKIDGGQEILSTEHEFSGALTCMESRERRDGVALRLIRLYSRPEEFDPSTVVDRVIGAVTGHTRVLALTWVYSNTGIKLPIGDIAARLREINKGRPANEAVLLCVDGVHGLGIEAETFATLGCDFFVSGCHKSTFGPRGSGIWCGSPSAWAACDVICPTSSRTNAGPGRAMSPGGVQDYEHRWAVGECFDNLRNVGRQRITDRVHELASMAKYELGRFNKTTMVTPVAAAFSSGIVCFDIAGHTADEVVDRLAARGVVATQSSLDRPVAARHVRLSISIFNSEEDIAAALDVIRPLAT